MAKGEQITRFAQQHEMVMLSIEELVDHRRAMEA